jgi:hypothetical protein
MMNPPPFPIELKALKSCQAELNEQRNVFCPQYSGCLNAALARGWEDFSCRECAFFSRDTAPTAAAYALQQPRAQWD